MMSSSLTDLRLYLEMEGITNITTIGLLRKMKNTIGGEQKTILTIRAILTVYSRV
jgi:hypothetical protein